MYGIVTLVVVLVVSILVVRIATVALTLTGLSEQLARFQARSAFTGTGFTTNESERVMQHPVRRRIIMVLLLLGNAGIVTAISSLMLSFVDSKPSDRISSQTWFRLVVLTVSLAALWTLAHSSWVDRRMSRIIAWALKRWTKLDARDYAGLLHLTGEYLVAELAVNSGDWLADRQLKELSLSNEGVVVLGVERAGGGYLGAPRGDTMLAEGDTVLVYGRKPILQELDQRRQGSGGNREHVAAVAEQKGVEIQEKQMENGSASINS